MDIARLGRAAGIHLIICTQRPDAHAAPGQLKPNLAGTVAFRVRSGVNSLIFLARDRAALLQHPPGRAVLAHDRLEEFQAIHTGDDQSRRLLTERWGETRIVGAPGHVTPVRQSPEEGSADVDEVPSW